jgi:hypothetical protein
MKVRLVKGELEPAPEVDYTRTIEELAMRGTSISECSDLGFPMTRPELRQAHARGKALGVSNVAGVVYQRAMMGDLKAAGMYLEAQGGPAWRDGEPELIEGGKMTLMALRQAFAKEIENPPDDD